MSLFRYKVLLADDKEKTSQITAKSEAAARARVAELNKVKEWRWLKEVKAAEQSAPVSKVAVPAKSAAVATKPAAPAPKPAAAKPRTKLDELLFQQSNKCFFCGRLLAKAEASIEHLQPKSDGGTNANGNLVACCVTLNRTFGDISLKRKMEIVLEKAGNFTCPADANKTSRP